MTQQTPALPETHLHELSSEPRQTQITTTPETPTPETLSAEQPVSSIIVRAPRSPWWEFFLHFATFGFYTNFWLVVRVKEIKRLSGHPLKPWLWLFVPSLVFVQPFAFPKLDKILCKIEGNADIRYPDNRFNLWLAAVFLVSAFFWLSTEYATPNWLSLVALIFWSGLFGLFSQRLNTIKQQLNHVEFKGKSSGYAFWEWVIVILLTPITFGALIYASISPFMLNEISSLPDQTAYVDPNNHFQLTVHGDGWREVEVGSLSDGTAELELAGSVEDAFFLVFKTSPPITLNDIVDSRIAFIQTQYPDIKCHEERSLVQGQLAVMIHVMCEGQYMRDPVLQTITAFEKGNDTYELFGTLSTPKLTYSALSAEFKQMAKEFQPL